MVSVVLVGPFAGARSPRSLPRSGPQRRITGSANLTVAIRPGAPCRLTFTRPAATIRGAAPRALQRGVRLLPRTPPRRTGTLPSFPIRRDLPRSDPCHLSASSINQPSRQSRAPRVASHSPGPPQCSAELPAPQPSGREHRRLPPAERRFNAKTANSRSGIQPRQTGRPVASSTPGPPRDSRSCPYHSPQAVDAASSRRRSGASTRKPQTQDPASSRGRPGAPCRLTFTRPAARFAELPVP
jgi:hypothetical protein